MQIVKCLKSSVKWWSPGKEYFVHTFSGGSTQISDNHFSRTTAHFARAVAYKNGLAEYAIPGIENCRFIEVNIDG